MRRALLLALLCSGMPAAADAPDIDWNLAKFHEAYMDFALTFYGCDPGKPPEGAMAYTIQCRPEMGRFDLNLFERARRRGKELFQY